MYIHKSVSTLLSHQLPFLVKAQAEIHVWFNATMHVGFVSGMPINFLFNGKTVSYDGRSELDDDG